MKKRYIIIGTIILFTTTMLIIIKPKKEKIEQVNNNLDTQIKEEVKKEIEEIQEDICEEIHKPLMTKESEDGYPIHDSNGPITEEKLKIIIDNQLQFLIYKNNYQEITSDDLFYEAIMDKSIYTSETFSKEDLKNSLEKTVLSNLKLKHESHFSERNYIYEDGIYNVEKTEQEKEKNEIPLYGEVQTFKEKNGIYEISIKYLWTSYNEQSSIIYKNRYDAKKKINKIQIPNNIKCQSKWLKDNFKKYEKDLPIYTYAFKEVNNHIYLVDYYIKESN